MGSLRRCRGGFRTTGSGKVPGKVPNHGFREGSGTGSGAVGDNTWAYLDIFVLNIKEGFLLTPVTN